MEKDERGPLKETYNITQYGKQKTLLSLSFYKTEVQRSKKMCTSTELGLEPRPHHHTPPTLAWPHWQSPNNTRVQCDIKKLAYSREKMGKEAFKKCK